MDEANIAASLLQNVPQTQDEPVTPTPVQGEKGYTDNIPNFNAYRMLDYFEINTQYRAHAEPQVQEIFDWAAKKAGTDNYLEVMQYIKQTEQMLGIQHRENRLMKLVEYAKLDAQKQRIENEMQIKYGQ